GDNFLVIGIGVYTMTLKYTDPNTGVTRTALEGLKIYLVPNFEGVTASKLITIVLDAAGQLFYSMSIAMGIMITYGSYCKKDANLVKSVNSIEIFDSGVALLAGLIVIPSVVVFQGAENLGNGGPGLMFISLPTVFEQMGFIGHIVGALFFVLVLFAALTSSISLMETIAASFIDKFKWSRPKASVITFVISVVLGVVTCLGYNVFYFDLKLPNGSVGQILDIFDYVSNNLLLPIVAFLTCILIGWLTKPDTIVEEVKIGFGEKKFVREGLYRVMIRFVAPVILIIILLQSFNVFSFLG
ncbi:MAG: sodium-dependent transporter, partial [Clostridia bacterium]|nr:sodium-dependent transporter [Clostridia bacterium]